MKRKAGKNSTRQARIQKKDLPGYVFWILLLSCGLIALARFLHPAMFSAELFVLMVAATAISGVYILAKRV